MRGPTGFIRSASSNDIIGQVTRITACLVHRGRNDEEASAECNVGLGHRWLWKLVLTLTHAQNLMFQARTNLEAA